MYCVLYLASTTYSSSTCANTMCILETSNVYNLSLNSYLVCSLAHFYASIWNKIYFSVFTHLAGPWPGKAASAWKPPQLFLIRLHCGIYVVLPPAYVQLLSCRAERATWVRGVASQTTSQYIVWVFWRKSIEKSKMPIVRVEASVS